MLITHPIHNVYIIDNFGVEFPSYPGYNSLVIDHNTKADPTIPVQCYEVVQLSTLSNCACFLSTCIQKWNFLTLIMFIGWQCTQKNVALQCMVHRPFLSSNSLSFDIISSLLLMYMYYLSANTSYICCIGFIIYSWPSCNAQISTRHTGLGKVTKFYTNIVKLSWCRL